MISGWTRAIDDGRNRALFEEADALAEELYRLAADAEASGYIVVHVDPRAPTGAVFEAGRGGGGAFTIQIAGGGADAEGDNCPTVRGAIASIRERFVDVDQLAGHGDGGDHADE